MTATPHNGKDEDYQLFLALLDPDRFEGKVRDGRRPDFSDLMRRLVKEQLLKFDGKPLFPERRAYSPTYELSAAEGQLAVVVVADGAAVEVHFLRQPFTREPDFSATSVNYDLWDLLGRAEAPA